MAVEEIPAPSSPSDNPTWQRFTQRFPTKRIFGDKEVPDPDAVSAEAARLRQDPNAQQIAGDTTNDPQTLEVIASYLRTLIQESELAQIADEMGMPEDAHWQLMQANKAYKQAMDRVLGVEDKVQDGADMPEEEAFEAMQPKAADKNGTPPLQSGSTLDTKA